MKLLMKKIINFVIKIFPIKDNKILFQSGRNKVDCNPYAIYKYIKENCPKDFRCVWLVEKNTDISMLEVGDFYYYNTIKGIYHQVTAKYWIRSQSLGGLIQKRKKQVYIQTWHGAGALKKSGYDCLLKEERPQEELDHVKDWDYFIATDKENEKAMISSTNYSGKTLILGNAESDLIVNATNEDKKRILSKLKLEKNKKKIILYAPTFRDNELEDTSKFNLHINKLKELEEHLILLRLHPLMNKKIENNNLPNNFIDVGDYPNIQDLYLISDILITDYSSIIFPFAILNKKIIFYPYDIKEYIKLRGGFYLKYNSLPGPICYNENELTDTIKQINLYPEYKTKLQDFNKKYNYLNDGKVCERFIKKLKENYFK